MVPDVSKKHSAFVFKGQEAFSCFLRMGHFVTLKHWEMPSDMSYAQKTWLRSTDAGISGQVEELFGFQVRLCCMEGIHSVFLCNFESLQTCI